MYKTEFMKRFPSVKARKYPLNFGFKGGILFKISGKQSLNFNGSHLSKAPTNHNTFPNARLNNSIVDGLQSV
jgi:hypothetical protein